MNRRELLNLLAVVSAGSSIGICIRPAHSRSTNIIDEIVFERPWLEIEEFTRLRRLTAVFAYLRISYSGPNGYEGEPNFSKGVWQARRLAFGESDIDGFMRAKEDIVPKLEGGLDKSINNQMQDIFKKNEEQFVGWLGEIGVAPAGTVQTDILRAQALFALIAGIRSGNGDLAFFSEFTWIYPFC